MACTPIATNVVAITDAINLVGLGSDDCPRPIANGPTGYSLQSTGGGLQWAESHPAANFSQEAAPFAWNSATQCGVIPNWPTLVSDGAGNYTFTPGDGSAATTFFAGSETVFAATSTNPFLTITAGGTNGHAPILAYDLASNLGALTVGAQGVAGVDSYIGSDGQIHLLPADCCPRMVDNGNGSYTMTNGDGTTVTITLPTGTTETPFAAVAGAGISITAGGTNGHSPTIATTPTNLTSAGVCDVPAFLIGTDNTSLIKYNPNPLRAAHAVYDEAQQQLAVSVNGSAAQFVHTNVAGPIAETAYYTGQFTVSNPSCFTMEGFVTIPPMGCMKFRKSVLAANLQAAVFCYVDIGAGFAAIPVSGHLLQEEANGNTADWQFTNYVPRFSVATGGSLTIRWQMRYAIFAGTNLAELRTRVFPVTIFGVATR